MTAPASNDALMEDIVGLCKRRGFIFASSEIYGGYNGFYDYGPLGVELRNNIKQAWWRDMVQRRDDIEGLDSTIIMHPNIWKASGHIDSFSDPLVDCKESKRRYRADQLFFAPVILDGENVGYVAFVEGTDGASIIKRAKKLRDNLDKKQSKLDEAALSSDHTEFTEATDAQRELTLAPDANKVGTLTAPRAFKLMFETKVGPLADDSAVAYLRPETAQGIFANYKNIVDTGRVKIPFGIAQIGKAFRNEITPRNFIFRSREFEQMEIEYFIAPDADWKALHREWIDTCTDWLVSIGLSREGITEDIHPEDKLSFYSQATTDLMYQFPHGEQELWGIACRSDYDLQQHQKHSGKSMEIFDESSKTKYVPHVIEPSLGVDRTLLAVLTAAYTEDEVPNDKGKVEKRTVMKFSPKIAPVKAAVFPLLKNKPELVEVAEKLYKKLQRRWNVFYDASGAIGRRYRRQDEIGTPFGITIDFDTIEKDGTVTLRDRDTCEQRRVTEAELFEFLEEQIDG
ncbi:glycine--tRNA ligase [Coraliomargarita sp. SDUM461004]|uniref:Glycine--tRNA ligase n=1 Tax=Thalassobacterium sedimentorum TaxID=3041258 RepID=A0ABU1AGN5_9BACT|nr:glycine--tRNA ligase [Coraliomargarita sp. SDUM461004]MDQ8193992.1 glycine--tRNA ligase [Coraliomargarita sp. SDUM461004]